jgi:TonB family protein
VTLYGIAALSACTEGSGDQRVGMQPQLGVRPDEAPVMVNRDLPFRYPAALYARQVQGNVTLRLFIDRDGRVRPESTRVEESSGHGPLDSAAVTGSEQLQFIPAKLHGEPMGVIVSFPVYFRHPEAAPLPGDTILGKREAVSGKRAPDAAARP